MLRAVIGPPLDGRDLRIYRRGGLLRVRSRREFPAVSPASNIQPIGPPPAEKKTAGQQICAGATRPKPTACEGRGKNAKISLPHPCAVLYLLKTKYLGETADSDANLYNNVEIIGTSGTGDLVAAAATEPTYIAVYRVDPKTGALKEISTTRDPQSTGAFLNITAFPLRPVD